MDVSVSHKMLNCQALKSPIFSAFLFAAIVFVIYAGTHISDLSIYNPGDIVTIVYNNKAPQTPTASDVYEAQRTARAPDTQVQQSTSNSTMPPLATPEKTPENSWPLPTTQPTNEEEEVDSTEAPDPINPPSNFSRAERIEWFRRNAPELEILNSKDSGERFHSRVLQFFDKNCTNRFYMIWLSPAQKFGPREFLAVDSLLKANPEACLMILSSSLDSRHGHRIFKRLLDSGLKILAVKPDLPFLVKNTPAEAWLDEIKSGRWYPGDVSFTIHLSDLIRLAVLYRYGGIYLDTDFVVINNFTGLRNTVGVQTIDQKTWQWKHVNNALLIFDILHPILFEFLKDFARNYNGDKWGQNGPYMLSRVIRRLNSEGKPGYNITLLSTKAFYPVDWVHINSFFWKPKKEKDSKWVEDTVAGLNRESYALHLWNSRSRGFVIEEGSVMQRLIESHCFICLDTYNS